MAVIIRIDCHCIKRIVIFLIGLLFCVVIIALMYNTVVTWGQDHRTLWVDIPGRLSFIIICCFMIGLCGYFPFPNSLRPDFMPEPILVWKFWNCKNACFPENEEQWFYIQNRRSDDLNHDNVQQSLDSQSRNAREYTNCENNQLNNSQDESQLHVNPLSYYKRSENHIPGSILSFRRVPLGTIPVNETSPLRPKHSGRSNHPAEVPWEELDLERYALQNELYHNRQSRANDNAMPTQRRLESSFRGEIVVFEDESLRTENEVQANRTWAKFSIDDFPQNNSDSKCIAEPHIGSKREIKADIFRDVSQDEQGLNDLSTDALAEIGISSRQESGNPLFRQQRKEYRNTSAELPGDMINSISKVERVSEVQARGRISSREEDVSCRNLRHSNISDIHYRSRFENTGDSDYIISGIQVENEYPRIIARTSSKQSCLTDADTCQSLYQTLKGKRFTLLSNRESTAKKSCSQVVASSIAKHDRTSKTRSINTDDEGTGGIHSNCDINFGSTLHEFEEFQNFVNEPKETGSKGKKMKSKKWRKHLKHLKP